VAAVSELHLVLLFRGDNREKKSIPSKGVSTAASKKFNSKICPEKQTVKRQNPHAGMVLPLTPTRRHHDGVLQNGQ
jgi:hypothetical protein